MFVFDEDAYDTYVDATAVWDYKPIAGKNGRAVYEVWTKAQVFRSYMSLPHQKNIKKGYVCYDELTETMVDVHREGEKYYLKDRWDQELDDQWFENDVDASIDLYCDEDEYEEHEIDYERLKEKIRRMNEMIGAFYDENDERAIIEWLITSLPSLNKHMTLLEASEGCADKNYRGNGQILSVMCENDSHSKLAYKVLKNSVEQIIEGAFYECRGSQELLRERLEKKLYFLIQISTKGSDFESYILAFITNTLMRPIQLIFGIDTVDAYGVIRNRFTPLVVVLLHGVSAEYILHNTKYHPNGFYRVLLAATALYKLRLHVWSCKYPSREDAHDHQADFSSSTMNAGYDNQLYEFTTSDDENAIELQYYEVMREDAVYILDRPTPIYVTKLPSAISVRSPSTYILHHTSLHTVDNPNPETVTLTCRGGAIDKKCSLLATEPLTSARIEMNAVNSDDIRLIFELVNKRCVRSK